MYVHVPVIVRNRDPHKENVENILAICLPIVTMQHIRESSSAIHAMGISAWNDLNQFLNYSTLVGIRNQTFAGMLDLESHSWFILESHGSELESKMFFSKTLLIGMLMNISFSNVFFPTGQSAFLKVKNKKWKIKCNAPHSHFLYNFSLYLI